MSNNYSRSSSCKHLLIYLPDLGGAPRTADVAERLRKALEKQTKNNHRGRTTTTTTNGPLCGTNFSFRRKCTGALEYENKLEIVKHTIFFSKEEDDDPLVDIIQFPYYHHLSRSSILGSVPAIYVLEMFGVVIAWIFAVLFVGLPRALGCFFCCGFPQLRRLRSVSQLFWVTSLFWASALYLCALVWSLYEVSSQRIDNSLSQRITFTTTIAMIVATFLMPSTLVQRIGEIYHGYLMTMRYYNIHSRRFAVQTGLNNLINQARSEWSCYTKITIVGYSLGSIIALDAVYPTVEDARSGKAVPVRTFDSLITLGCPFDLVRMLLPNYYSNNRLVEEKKGFRWTNIFIPADAFGSSFNDSSHCGAPHQGEEQANIDVNGNRLTDVVELEKAKEQNSGGEETNLSPKAPSGIPTNIVYRRGLIGSSRWLDELQLTLGAIVGYLTYAHLCYVVFSDGMYLVFDNTVAWHIAETLLCDDSTMQP